MTQPAEPREPRNPFYFLLLIASAVFAITAVAYALVPILVEKAKDAGADVPPSAWRQSLNDNGGTWLLCELGAMILFGLLSMGLDRLRRLQKERAEATIPSTKDPANPS
jgi:hypothetical protein